MTLPQCSHFGYPAEVQHPLQELKEGFLLRQTNDRNLGTSKIRFPRESSLK